MDATGLTELIAEEVRNQIADGFSIAMIRIQELSPWKKFRPFSGSPEDGSKEQDKVRDIVFDVIARMDLGMSGGANPLDIVPGVVKRTMQGYCPEDHELRSGGVAAILKDVFEQGKIPSAEEIGKVVAAFVLGKWVDSPGLKEGWGDKWEAWAERISGTKEYSILVLGVACEPPDTDGCLEQPSYREATVPFNPKETVDPSSLVSHALRQVGCTKG